MSDEEAHLSDQDLLLAADGELSRRRAKQIRVHLAACSVCRTRLREIEDAIADFVHSHRSALDPQLPAPAGSRARLKAQLAELASQPSIGLSSRLLQFILPTRAVAYICLGLLMAAVGAELLFQNYPLHRLVSPASQFENGVIPNHSLTPGATRPVAISDVCSMVHEEVVRAVPTALRQEVFKEYGIANARAEDYEIDYLIAPGLGGTEDIRNLWPESYTSPTWNAHVKDALEERLHQLVCEGKLDLPTAQREIATDWIAAYKKYFHTSKPLPNLNASLEPIGGMRDAVVSATKNHSDRAAQIIALRGHELAFRWIPS